MKHFKWLGSPTVALACLVMGTAVFAQGNPGQFYTTVQIEQYVAPVALYPDALLAQVFMASTYPGEVVEANLWVRQNPGLRGDALALALDDQNWDVSVKSLVPFPVVLTRMAENGAWTQDLGDAYLSQPTDVMNSVQNLRHRAYTAGNLRTSNYQRVVVSGQYIQVVPVSIETVYVPAYNPMVVYGAGWGYSSYYYPAMMRPPPYYQAGTAISFGVGFFVGAALFGAFDWDHHNVYYGDNFYRYGGYNRSAQVWQERYPNARPGSHTRWEHDPIHRGSGGYRNPVLNERYGRASTTRIERGTVPGSAPPPVVRNPAPQNRQQQPRTTSAQPTRQVRQPKATSPKPSGQAQPTRATSPRSSSQERQPKAVNPKKSSQAQPTRATSPRPSSQERQPKAVNPKKSSQAQPTRTTSPRPSGQERQPKAVNPKKSSQAQPTRATSPRPSGQERQQKATNPKKSSGQAPQSAKSHDAPNKGGGKKGEQKK